MTITIGLTGGIATGKSTVSKMFAQLEIPVIDTDQIAFDLLKKGTDEYYEIVEAFEGDILLSDLEINRKKLGKIIFYDNDKRELLNNIIHPRVKTLALGEVQRLRKLGHKLIVVDVPLLFETGFSVWVDKTILVTTSHENQLQRLMNRDCISVEYAEQKIASQMSMEEKMKLADYIIDNSSSVLETKKEFNKILKELEVE